MRHDVKPLERGRELRSLRERLAAATAGTGSVVVVRGPAGAGKTTLLRALGGETTGVARVLTARGAELERELPFGVVRQLIERPLLESDDAEALLAGPAFPIRALLDATVDEPPETPAAVAHGLYWVLARLADRQPLCVLVDDLQWADPPSADALAYVARRVDGHPAVLAATARDDEPDTVGWQRLEAIEGAHVLHPAPLSEAACARLAGGERVFGAACHRVTGGNARLLVELLAACREQGIAPDAAGAARVATLAPAGVARIVLERIERLGPDAAALARAVAVLDHTRAADAAALARLAPEAAGAATDRLVAAGVLDDGLPLRFAHPLARTTVEADMTDVARDRAHRRAAELLAPRHAEAAALHLLRCEPAAERWAVEALRAAARDALQRGTPSAAVRLLDRAGAEGGDVREELIPALLATGDPRAAEELHAALATTTDRGERARLAGLAGQAQFAAGDVRGAIETLRAGLAEAEAAADPRGTDELVFAAASLGVDDPALSLAAAERARDASGDPRLEAFDAFERFRAGRPAAEVVSRAGAPLAELSRLTGAEIAPTFHLAVFALAGCDALDEADAALDGAFELARRRGSRLTYGLACFLRVWCRWRRGDLPGVLADCEELLGFAAEGWGVVVPNVRWLQAECALLRGDPDACRAALAEGVAGADESGWQIAHAWLLNARAGVHLLDGDAERALADALRCGALMIERRTPTPAIVDWRGRAVRAALALGDRDRARELAADAVRRAETVGAARTLALAHRADALTCEEPERIERLRTAAGWAADGPSPVVHAAVLLDLGTALRRARRPRDAREPLRRALDLARRAGATGLAENARRELEATGARRRAEQAWGLEGLTPRERELARLAARDLSNTEIAERLFITRKTVESHLGAVYRKLGIGSRQELATALAGPGDGIETRLEAR